MWLRPVTIKEGGENDIDLSGYRVRPMFWLVTGSQKVDVLVGLRKGDRSIPLDGFDRIEP
jgi:hypothetical protein